MEEEFYATLKLKTGEELFCKVCASEEDDRTLLLVSHPITVQEIKNKIGIIGYKVEPWLKTTDEDLFIINLEDILTMSESADTEMIGMFESFIKDSAMEKNTKHRMNRRMGYLGNVNDTKETLEKLFKEN